MTLMAALSSGVAPCARSAAKSLQKLTWETLALWETLMPITEHAIIVHLAVHLMQQLLHAGPLVTCYPWERFCGWLGRLIGKTSMPEINAINAYSTFMWVTEQVNVLGLVGKLSDLRVINPFMSDMITDLFDVSLSMMTKEVAIYMQDKRTAVIPALRRKIHELCGSASVCSIEAGYRRAVFKGRVLGVERSLEHCSWITLKGNRPAQVIDFIEVRSVDNNRFFVVVAKLMTNVASGLYTKLASGSVVVDLVRNIEAQVALGPVSCPECPNANCIPESHDRACVMCQHMIMYVTQFENY